MTMSRFEQLNSILLIDDDESSNFLHSIFINKLDLDIEINTALNGQEGMDFIMNRGLERLSLPCMVMLDLKMPVKDGWDFMRMYEEQVPEEVKQQLAIVLVTVSDNPQDKERAAANPHILDFAQKPLSDSTFKKLIEKHFNLKETV